MSHHQTSPLHWTVSPHRTKSRHHRRQFVKPLSCLTASHCRARQRIHERTGRHSRLPRKRVSKHCSRPTEGITLKYSLTTQIDRNIFFGTKQKKKLKAFSYFSIAFIAALSASTTAASHAVVVEIGCFVFNPRALAVHVASKPRRFLLLLHLLRFRPLFLCERNIALTGRALKVHELF